MWLPASLVPARVSADAWTRHLVARLGASALAGVALIALPGLVDALAEATGSVCLARAVAGLPCPGCGITTSLIALGRGDVAASWAANPAGAAVAALLAGQALIAGRALLVRHPAVSGSRVLGWLDRAAVASLGAAWVARLVVGS